MAFYSLKNNKKEKKRKKIKFFSKTDLNIHISLSILIRCQ